MLISLVGGGRMTPRELQALMRGMAAAVLMSVRADGAKAPLRSFIMLPMLAAKMKAPEAYARMVAASNGAAGVIDCMAELMDEQRTTPDTPVNPGVAEECLDLIETTLYRACRDPIRAGWRPGTYFGVGGGSQGLGGGGGRLDAACVEKPWAGGCEGEAFAAAHRKKRRGGPAAGEFPVNPHLGRAHQHDSSGALAAPRGADETRMSVAFGQKCDE